MEKAVGDDTVLGECWPRQRNRAGWLGRALLSLSSAPDIRQGGTGTTQGERCRLWMCLGRNSQHRTLPTAGDWHCQPRKGKVSNPYKKPLPAFWGEKDGGRGLLLGC